MHSHLREEGLPKRDPARSHYSHSSNSCLSEGSPPERGKPLVWASILRLSESWARMHPVLFSSMLIGMNTILWYMYVLVCIYKVWYEWICMSDVIHGVWMMNLDKSSHAISMKWLVIYVVMNSIWTIRLHWWHGIGMRWSSISPNWEEWDGMKSTWNMNEDEL